MTRQPRAARPRRRPSVAARAAPGLGGRSSFPCGVAVTICTDLCCSFVTLYITKLCILKRYAHAVSGAGRAHLARVSRRVDTDISDIRRREVAAETDRAELAPCSSLLTSRRTKMNWRAHSARSGRRPDALFAVRPSRWAALACGHGRHRACPLLYVCLDRDSSALRSFSEIARRSGFTPTVERLRWACPGSL